MVQCPKSNQPIWKNKFAMILSSYFFTKIARIEVWMLLKWVEIKIWHYFKLARIKLSIRYCNFCRSQKCQKIEISLLQIAKIYKLWTVYIWGTVQFFQIDKMWVCTNLKAQISNFAQWIMKMALFRLRSLYFTYFLPSKYINQLHLLLKPIQKLFNLFVFQRSMFLM